MLMNDSDRLQIGAVLFPHMDQADFTGPFEVLSRLPNSQFHVLAKEKMPIRDAKNLILTPEETLQDAPQLDLLLVPGGAGVNAFSTHLSHRSTVETRRRRHLRCCKRDKRPSAS